MGNFNNIPHFTAVDIEKYHRGLLSPKEMHDLEKAAMDDPFLADALEGYGIAGVNAGNDIAELKRRLADKTQGAKVIPMNTAPKNNFRILRAAVVVAFVAGAGLLIYQFGFNNKKDSIAQAEPAKKENVKITDTGKAANPSTTGTVSTPVSEIKSTSPGTGPATNAPVILPDDTKKPDADGAVAVDKESAETVVTAKRSTLDDVSTKPGETKPAVVTAPVKLGDEKDAKFYKTPEQKELAREESLSKQKNNRKDENKDFVRDQQVVQQNNSGIVSRGAEQNNTNNQRSRATNVFQGVVTDAHNNGVPFANVTNVQDNNAGTYTDARGYFNLTYPDSVLTVQVRSIGFENTNVQLRNNVPTNQVVLQDDQTLERRVVSGAFKTKAEDRNPTANMKMEEPEPVDGWTNYNTYIANNLTIPEDLKDKKITSGEVQLSFEVDKDGEPTKITVVKSLCTQCDKEAIRLLKAGPKWKRAATKKGRTTVTISF